MYFQVVLYAHDCSYECTPHNPYKLVDTALDTDRIGSMVTVYSHFVSPDLIFHSCSLVFSTSAGDSFVLAKWRLCMVVNFPEFFPLSNLHSLSKPLSLDTFSSTCIKLYILLVFPYK